MREISGTRNLLCTPLPVPIPASSRQELISDLLYSVFD